MIKFPKYDVFKTLNIVFTSPTSVYFDEMQHYAAFHLHLYCLEMNSLRGFQNPNINEACIWVLEIPDICHFTSRDIGYYPFYFRRYGILYKIFLFL